MFEETINLFDRYYQTLDQHIDPDVSRNHGSEVRARLGQLEYILGRVRACEQEAGDALGRAQRAFHDHVERVHREGLDYQTVPSPPDAKITKAEYQRAEAAQTEMRVMTEAFYYFAGRVRSILRHKSTPLPGLERFECEGVRNVRNKLIEHPEGSDSRVLIQSWAWGHPGGPVLKAARYGGQENVFPDRGLYINAEEFRANLTKVLEQALNDRGA